MKRLIVLLVMIVLIGCGLQSSSSVRFDVEVKTKEGEIMSYTNVKVVYTHKYFGNMHISGVKLKTDRDVIVVIRELRDITITQTAIKR